MIDLHEYLAVGQNSMISKTVQRSDTSAEYSNDLTDLLATPTCIHLAIQAAMKTIDPYLPHDFVSVGLSVSFTHTAPTSLGMTVTIRTAIISIDGPNITLEIQAWDEQGEIGHGLHTRCIVQREEVERRAQERTRLLLHKQFNF